MRRAADAFAVNVMGVLCLLWGLQQTAIKLAAPDAAPLVQASLRSLIAAVLVAILLVRRGEHRAARGTLRGGLLTGALFSLEFLFIALALQHTHASHVVVFLYTSPIFSAIGLHLVAPTERLRRLQWIGIATCFAGIVVAFGGGLPTLGDGLAVLAGTAWGLSTVAIRASRLSEAPATLTLLYQLVLASLFLPVMAVGFGQTHLALTTTAIGSILFQGVIVSFASYLTWFWLLRRYLASNLAVFSFMTPLFGVTAGVVLLGEPLAATFVVGAALVVAGILLVSGERWLRDRLRR
jgi:drug/metabolite transporter (DMT)-like permease